jgi:hypothetical protein
MTTSSVHLQGLHQTIPSSDCTKQLAEYDGLEVRVAKVLIWVAATVTAARRRTTASRDSGVGAAKCRPCGSEIGERYSSLRLVCSGSIPTGRRCRTSEVSQDFADPLTPDDGAERACRSIHVLTWEGLGALVISSLFRRRLTLPVFHNDTFSYFSQCPFPLLIFAFTQFVLLCYCPAPSPVRLRSLKPLNRLVRNCSTVAAASAIKHI